jgi:hypothetical protein
MLITRLTCMVSVCMLAASLCLAQQAVKKMTNEDIIAMVSLGLTDDVIIDKVHAAGATDFDTSVAGLTALKQAKVSDAVIRAMINPNPAPASVASATKEAAAAPDPNDPRSPHESGLYWLAKQGPDKRMLRLEPSSHPGQKATPGFGKADVKALLPGQHAALRLTEPTPEFWFYFDEKSTGLSQSSSAATKPEDFTLARMDAKGKERQLVVGHASAFGGITNGVRPGDSVQVDIQKVSPGVYKVSPIKPLAPGEYCFVPSGAAGAFVTYAGRLFDFGVDQAK